MNLSTEDKRCKGVTKRGEPCRAAATAGGLCFFHTNPNKASELGRIGGRSKNRAAAEMVDPLPLSNAHLGRCGTLPITPGLCPYKTTPLPLLDDAIAVRDTVTRLIADVHAGKVEPKVIAVLTDLINLRLRALDAVKEFESLERSHLLTTDMQARRLAMMAALSDDGSE